MTSRFFLASMITVAAAGLLCQSAQAQERPGARFKFAPNVYKIEQARVPSDVDGPRMVKQGAMPRSSSFLGVDPGYLTRPQVAAVPVAQPQVSAKAFVPNTSFMPSFGQPINTQALQAGGPIAMAPSMPKAPVAAPARPVHTAKRPVSRQHIAKAVSGKLVKPSHTPAQSATPATYGNNVGYVPGGFVPVQSGYGASTRADVHGRIIRH